MNAVKLSPDGKRVNKSCDGNKNRNTHLGAKSGRSLFEWSRLSPFDERTKELNSFNSAQGDSSTHVLSGGARMKDS